MPEGGPGGHPSDVIPLSPHISHIVPFVFQEYMKLLRGILGMTEVFPLLAYEEVKWDPTIIVSEINQRRAEGRGKERDAQEVSSLGPFHSTTFPTILCSMHKMPFHDLEM